VQVGSVEIERVCVERVAAIDQAAAVAVPPPGGGPDELHLFVVLLDKPAGSAADAAASVKRSCQRALREHLNPLFKVAGVAVVSALSRNTSNKVLRRVLRDGLLASRAQGAKL
jgi:acetyl-CoA synthetase